MRLQLSGKLSNRNWLASANHSHTFKQISRDDTTWHWRNAAVVGQSIWYAMTNLCYAVNRVIELKFKICNIFQFLQQLFNCGEQIIDMLCSGYIWNKTETEQFCFSFISDMVTCEIEQKHPKTILKQSWNVLELFQFYFRCNQCIRNNHQQTYYSSVTMTTKCFTIYMCKHLNDN